MATTATAKDRVSTCGHETIEAIGPGMDAVAFEQAAAVPAGPRDHTLRAAVQRLGSVRILRPHADWAGVVLRLASARDVACRRFEVALSAGDGRAVVVATFDEEDAVAGWRAMAASAGLPLLMETPEGAVSAPFPQIGRIALGALRYRRRYGFLKGRRPRFLARRRTGDAARMQPVAGQEIARGPVA